MEETEKATTLLRIIEMISHVNYKPNVKFTGFYRDGGYFIRMDTETIDRDTHKPYTATLTMHLGVKPEKASEVELRDMLFNGILDFERHEAMEWFKYKGVRVHETHHKVEK